MWWSLFVGGIWHHLRPSEQHIWTIDRHTTKVVDVAVTLTPLAFVNVSVLWLDKERDSVHLDLVQTSDKTMGTVSVKDAIMNVYESGFDGGLVEVYTVNIDVDDIDKAHLHMLQNDSHYSPFRTIVLTPSVEWSLGGGVLMQEERVGQFKHGLWYEGEDPLQIFGGVLFAWCMGIVFLVVMRHPHEQQTVIVTGRQKRVFNKSDSVKR